MKSLSISIPEPCHEKWSTMTPTEKGRFCKKCTKEVVDYSQMHKLAITEDLMKRSSIPCGRFSNDQVDVNLLPARRNRLFGKWVAVFFSVLPFAGNSQTHFPLPVEVPIVSNVNRIVKSKVSRTSEKQQSIVVRGIVLDKNSKEPILFGTVAAYMNNVFITGVETDLDGKFKIEIPVGAAIEASFMGYKPKRIPYEKYKDQKDFVEIFIKEGVLMDATFVTGIMVVQKKESLVKRSFKKVKSLFENGLKSAKKNRREKLLQLDEEKDVEPLVQFKDVVKGISAIEINSRIKVFPNPTLGIVQIDVGELTLEGFVTITNIQNQLVLKKKIASKMMEFDLSLFPPGAYIMSIIEQGKLIRSEVVIKN